MSAIVLRLGVSVLAAGAVALFGWLAKRQYHSQGSSHTYSEHVQTPNRTEKKEQKCAVCNRKMDSTLGGLFTLSCTHKFHGNCLKEVFDQELASLWSCPYRNCRRIVREYEVDQIIRAA